MTSTLLTSGALPKARIFGEPQLHTDGELLALNFAPDGSLWSVEEPGVLRHWSAENGQQLEWSSLSDLETLWVFSPDMRILASASDDLTLWDVSSGQILTALAQASWVSALAFAGDPAFLATGHDDGVVRYWDAAGHHLVHEMRLHKNAISALAFDSSGKVLAAAGEDKLISLWDVATGKHLGNLEGHTDRIPALAWQPGTQVLVSAGWDSTARVWDAQKREPIILLNNHSQQVTALAFEGSGKIMASADSAGQVYVWDFATRKVRHTHKFPQSEMRALAFSKDGRRLAASGERVIHLMDTVGGGAMAGSGPRPTAVTRMALDREGKRLASNGGGSQGRLWSLAAAKGPIALVEDQTLHALRFSPDGKSLAGAATKHVRVWDTATGNPTLEMVGPETDINTLAFSSDGTALAAAGSNGLAAWIFSTRDGEPTLLIPDALDGCTIESLAFHPEGQLLAVGGIDWLATGGSNGALSIWDIANRREISAFPEGTTCLVYHPSGARIAFATLEHSIGIWDGESDDLANELQGHEDAVTALAYSPDGKWLASGGADRTIRFWDEEGEERAVLEVDSQITDLAFSPDGESLYTANANTTCCEFQVAEILRRGK